jgi:hypothetical protein
MTRLGQRLERMPNVYSKPSSPSTAWMPPFRRSITRVSRASLADTYSPLSTKKPSPVGKTNVSVLSSPHDVNGTIVVQFNLPWHSPSEIVLVQSGTSETRGVSRARFYGRSAARRQVHVALASTSPTRFWGEEQQQGPTAVRSCAFITVHSGGRMVGRGADPPNADPTCAR